MTAATFPASRARPDQLYHVVRGLLQVVNVLDEVHNPGLRETIKTFSQWPTIPQAGCIAARVSHIMHLSHALRS